MSTAIEMSAISVAAGGKTLLGPLDLSIAAGEHVVVLGPSGCGKTTLLRLIAGLAKPASGTLLMDGKLASEASRIHLPAEKRNIGMLFQEGALWPHMNVSKTLDFVLAHGAVPKQARPARIAELLEQVELTGYEKRKPGTLSGGEAQRLGLARALACAPSILLLDEPLGPLDAGLRHSLLQRIDAIQKEKNLTLVHVTHDPEEAEQYADRTLTMAAGQIASDNHHPPGTSV